LELTKDASKMPAALRPMNVVFGFWPTEYDGTQAIAFHHQGRSDIVITFSDLIRVFYVDRPGISRKLYTVLLFACRLVFFRKGAVLLHAASAAKGDHCVILTGHRGAKKTMILLTMLKHGWDYLSDDKCLLCREKVYLLQSFAAIREHHVETLSFLKQTEPYRHLFTKWKGLSTRVGDFVERHANKHLLPGLDRLVNPYRRLEIKELFPDRAILWSGKPSVVFLLLTGARLSSNRLSRSEGIENIHLTQNLAFGEFSSLEDLLFLYDKRYAFDPLHIIDKNIGEPQFYKIVIPGDCDTEHIYGEILECLK